LESLIAGFYERAGMVELNDGTKGSVTIGGSVSPAGGNFEEPVTQATLKVVGAFLALSRERSNARRFPSIHPLDSWSHYQSVVDDKKVEDARSLLRRGNDVNQMMKVIGEDGTSMDDFVLYLKAELLDFVYLQQNTFDKVDACCTKDRQNYLFDKVKYVLDSKFKFDDKDQARRYFMELRQAFTDWNYAPFDSEDAKTQEKAIDGKIEERIDA
jgi:V/A-type H+-transporting ATPase subunit A